MDRMDIIDEIEDFGAASVETQGVNGIQADTDLQPNFGSGISND